MTLEIGHHLWTFPKSNLEGLYCDWLNEEFSSGYF